MRRIATSLLASVMLTAGWIAIVRGQGASGLPIEPVKESGQSVTGAFEGWYQNSDGSYTLLVGYFNRNAKQSLDIPIGPNNRIEPGGPDLGQPTHFQPRRQWGVFTIVVPKGFGKNRLTWTIVANGRPRRSPCTSIRCGSSSRSRTLRLATLRRFCGSTRRGSLSPDHPKVSQRPTPQPWPHL
jgi:hypothetical protein